LCECVFKKVELLSFFQAPPNFPSVLLTREAGFGYFSPLPAAIIFFSLERQVLVSKLLPFY